MITNFFYLNINNVLPKIDELCMLTKEVNPSVIGLIETKQDNDDDEKDLIETGKKEGWHVMLDVIFPTM